MVPDVASKGHSFNGAFAYYLHDKRREGEARRDTSERVAWTETRNLATDDPTVARKVMIATAQNADMLKKAAGVRSTGRKSSQHVYAYSLAWHPDERGRIDRAEMVRAVDASLKVLGADHLQAVIVCHQETKHPHVHVILNRVDPSTGRMHTFSNDHRKLDAWALAYREVRAEQHKYCPTRAAKRDARQRPELASTFTQATTRPRLAPADALQARTAELAKRSATMRAIHEQEWRTLSATGRATREGRYTAARADIVRAKAEVKEECRPMWRDLFRRQAHERRTMRRAGLLAVAMAAWTTTRGERGGKVDAAFVASMAFFVMSKAERERRLTTRHGRELRELGTFINRATDRRVQQIRNARVHALERDRRAFLERRAALIARQDLEKAQNRQDWRDLTAEKEIMRGSRPRDSASRHFQTAGEIRASLAGAGDRQIRRDRSPRSRGRSRSRTRDDPSPK